MCDACGEPVTDTLAVGPEDEQLVIAAAGAGYKHQDVHWRDYHRRCARSLTFADVWAAKGLVPL